jgi:hypothetical protein
MKRTRAASACECLHPSCVGYSSPQSSLEVSTMPWLPFSDGLFNPPFWECCHQAASHWYPLPLGRTWLQRASLANVLPLQGVPTPHGRKLSAISVQHGATQMGHFSSKAPQRFGRCFLSQHHNSISPSAQSWFFLSSWLWNPSTNLHTLLAQSLLLVELYLWNPDFPYIGKESEAQWGKLLANKWSQKQ